MAPAAVPSAVELIAPPDWGTVDFISDLHLDAGEPATFKAWQVYMQDTSADAVFMLGDLFEVWVGDDVIAADPDGFEAQCAEVIRQTAARACVFFMHGNRDFLVGEALMQSSHALLLTDPTVLLFEGQRVLLSHGDELCIDDVDYIKFRSMVRSPGWQHAFLAKPLAERITVARRLRAESEARKRLGACYADVDANMTRQWLRDADAKTLIHGHTHKPAGHDIGHGLKRIVLSDWDADADTPRAQILRLSKDGLQRINLL